MAGRDGTAAARRVKPTPTRHPTVRTLKTPHPATTKAPEDLRTYLDQVLMAGRDGAAVAQHLREVQARVEAGEMDPNERVFPDSMMDAAAHLLAVPRVCACGGVGGCACGGGGGVC